jgi:hypothetical protein
METDKNFKMKINNLFSQRDNVKLKLELLFKFECVMVNGVSKPFDLLELFESKSSNETIKEKSNYCYPVKTSSTGPSSRD